MSRAKKGLLGGILTVGGWTMLSRVFGFARDILIAATLGTGVVAEAFFMAFSLPNMFRRFFAEGAFNTAFVPMFAKKLDHPDDARDFARDAMSGLAGILVVLTILAMVFMPALVWLIASGFHGDARFDLTVLFGRIAFPYILFISLAALLSGVLNSTGRFVAAAAAPVLLNVLFITALGAGVVMGWDLGMTLAITVPIAGLAQLALVWMAARRAGFSLIPRLPRMTPELRQLAMIAAPAALAGGVVQVNLVIGRQVASYFEGANAWLYYADRLYQLPLGVVGIAVGIVLLPELSRHLGQGDEKAGQDAFNRALEFALALTVPCAVALLVIPQALIGALFERGNFTAADTQATAMAVAIYGLGLPAFVLQKVYQPLFFARSDTRRPFYYAILALVVNAAFALGLQNWLGFSAAAWGATGAAWGMLACLYLGARRHYEQAAKLDTQLHRRFWRILAASAVMGAVLFGANFALSPILTMGGVKYVAISALILSGVVSYAVAGHVVGAFSVQELRKSLRRGRA